jgi:hypothetical protein
MSSSLQNILMILGIVVIAALGYYMYSQNSASTLNNSGIDAQAAVGAENFIRRLEELKTISFDGVIFTDDRFESLVDGTKVVIPVTVGRENPFVPRN